MADVNFQVKKGLTVPNGSASSPSIIFDAADPNTGIYSPGADQVAISTAGSGRLFVDASGQIGLGSSPTAGEAVTVGGSLLVKQAADTNGYVTIQGSNTYVSTATNLILGINGSERLRITSAGLVGVGTSAPRTSLDLGTIDSVLTIGPSDARQGLRLGVSRRSSYGDGLIGKNLTGSSGSDDYVTPGNGNGGYSGIDFRYGGDTLIYGSNAATTAGASVSPPTRLIVKGDTGNVGIGTTSPAAPLEVVGSTNGDQLRINQGGQYYRIGREGAGGLLEFYGTQSGYNGYIFGGANGERARIDSSGRLLVGTSSARTGFFNTTVNNALLQVETTSQELISLSGIVNSNTIYGPSLILGKSRGATTNSATVVQNGDTLGILSFQGADGTQLVEGASVTAYVDGTPGADDLPSRLVFSTTADGASSPTERMRIKSNGTINFSNVATYADNTAALAGGLVAGDVYRKSDGTLMITY